MLFWFVLHSGEWVERNENVDELGCSSWARVVWFLGWRKMDAVEVREEEDGQNLVIGCRCR